MGGFFKINARIIAHLIGLLFVVNGGFMLLATLVSYLYQDGVVFELLQASLLATALGVIAIVLTRNHRKELQKKE